MFSVVLVLDCYLSMYVFYFGLEPWWLLSSFVSCIWSPGFVHQSSCIYTEFYLPPGLYLIFFFEHLDALLSFTITILMKPSFPFGLAHVSLWGIPYTKEAITVSTHLLKSALCPWMSPFQKTNHSFPIVIFIGRM